MEVKPRISQANPFVNLLEGKPIRPSCCERLVDEHAVILVWFLELFLGIICHVEFQRGRFRPGFLLLLFFRTPLCI
jgi:hypothetical protein